MTAPHPTRQDELRAKAIVENWPISPLQHASRIKELAEQFALVRAEADAAVVERCVLAVGEGKKDADSGGALALAKAIDRIKDRV